MGFLEPALVMIIRYSSITAHNVLHIICSFNIYMFFDLPPLFPYFNTIVTFPILIHISISGISSTFYILILIQKINFPTTCKIIFSQTNFPLQFYELFPISPCIRDFHSYIQPTNFRLSILNHN